MQELIDCTIQTGPSGLCVIQLCPTRATLVSGLVADLGMYTVVHAEQPEADLFGIRHAPKPGGSVFYRSAGHPTVKGVSGREAHNCQGLNQHRDYRNHEKYLNYTINFGHYLGGHLEVFRDEDWESCAAPLVWVEFTADIIQHRVREVTKGVRYSVTLFTPNHLERLSREDWMNLESFGFPVDKYAECDSCKSSVVKDPQVMEPPSTVKTEELLENCLESTVVQAVEQKVRAPSDPLESLSGQVPQPNASENRAAQLTLDSCALLTREFNAAMGLPKGELPRCIDKERGSAYGQMLWEEVQEVRDAVEGGVLHGVLAESIDVLYLVFNLLQECGLERAIEPAFLLKHGDNMKKQHETVTHLACTRKEYVQATGKSEEELAFTVSRTEGGKWLLYSKGKLIKPHDYVSSDFESILGMIATEESANGRDQAPKAHSSGPHTSQYTFANVGVQVAAASIDSSMRISGEEHHHGWQPALMTSCMWMANVAGEFLHRMDHCPQAGSSTTSGRSVRHHGASSGGPACGMEHP